MGDWSIVYVQMPLGVAIHGIIEIRDDAGNVVKSMEGLATDENGRTKPIGTSKSDRIQFRRSVGPSGNADYSTFAPQEVFSGSRQEVMARAALAEAAGAMINQKNIGYPPLVVNPFGPSTNSNAVISTLFKAMGLDDPFPDRPAPGRGTILLDSDEINAIRSRAGFSPINYDGGALPGQDENPLMRTSIDPSPTIYGAPQLPDSTRNAFAQMDDLHNILAHGRLAEAELKAMVDERERRKLFGIM